MLNEAKTKLGSSENLNSIKEEELKSKISASENIAK